MTVTANSTAVPTSATHKSSFAFLPILLIVASAFIVYRSTLFNFFCGDDYIHVEWLTRAIHDPSLIWRNFYGTWLDDRCAVYYRPLVSVSFVIDYLIWQENGLGFRITNILLLLTAGAMLHLIIRDLPSKDGEVSGLNRSWGLLAFALFVLYPLHPEAIVWITGRVDCLVGAFYIAGIWCYIRWRRNGQLGWFAATTTMLIASLCSKEMGISLPIAFVAYELVYGRDKGEPFFTRKYIAAILISFGLLGLYFYLRSIFLGSAVGGWDNALAIDWQKSGAIWIEGLRKMLLPFNEDVFRTHHKLEYAWGLLIMACAIASMVRFRLDKTRARDARFFVFLFAACMLPVYKVFTISGDLESSRYAYLATAPLCAFLTAWFGLEQGSPLLSERAQLLIRRASFAGAACLLVAAFSVLRLNCLPWQRAGEEVNAVRAGMRLINNANSTHKPLVLLGCPDNFEGAYICRNAMIGLTAEAKPNLWTTPPVPFGLLRNWLKTRHDAILVYWWDRQSLSFRKVDANLSNHPALQRTWTGEELKKILRSDPSPGLVTTWMKDGSLKIQSGDESPIFHLDFSGIDPSSIEFLALDLNQLDTGSDLSRIDLHYASDCCADGNIQPARVKIGDRQLFVFPLRGLMDWAFAHKLSSLDITLPPHSNLIVRQITSLKAAETIPIVTPSLSEQKFFESNGVISLGNLTETIPIEFNATSLPGAKQLLIEVSKPNYMFVHPNFPDTSPTLILKSLKVPTLRLNFPVNAALFPQPGFYQIRATALDSSDKPVGLPSDHLVFLKK
jgi:hypothetical protein